MKKKLLITILFAFLSYISYGQAAIILHVNGSGTDNGSVPVAPCSSQEYELLDPDNWPTGTSRVCSIRWEDGAYNTIQVTTGHVITFTVQSNMQLQAYVTYGDANCSQQTTIAATPISILASAIGMTTPVMANMPIMGCISPFSAVVGFDASKYTPPAGSYSVAWNVPAGWSASPAAFSTNITPDATSTGNISATVTLTACPSVTVTSPAVAISRPTPAVSFSSSNPTVGCGTSQVYAINPICGAASYTYVLSGNSGVSFASGTVTQSLTTTATSVPIYFSSVNGSYTLTVTANYPDGSSSASTAATYYFGVPTLSVTITKIVGDVFFADAGARYSGATFTWKVDNVLWESAVDQTTFNAEPSPCGVSHTVSVVATGVCGTTNTATNTVTTLCTGPQAIEPGVSPNPVQGAMKVYLPETDPTTGQATGKRTLIKAIRIVDKAGRIVKKIEYGTGVMEADVTTEGLSKDLYILQVFDGTQWTHREILVK